VFRGFGMVSIDSKGRLAIPSRFRQQLVEVNAARLVLTLNPLDRCLWLYLQLDWEQVESKLMELSDFDKESRRTKQMVCGYASDCQLDSQGRILLPMELREYALLQKQVVVLGQGNKFEIWDQARWEQQRDEWLSYVDEADGESSEALKLLSL